MSIWETRWEIRKQASIDVVCNACRYSDHIQVPSDEAISDALADASDLWDCHQELVLLESTRGMFWSFRLAIRGIFCAPEIRLSFVIELIEKYEREVLWELIQCPRCESGHLMWRAP
jgi:hypothetical protein